MCHFLTQVGFECLQRYLQSRQSRTRSILFGDISICSLGLWSGFLVPRGGYEPQCTSLGVSFNSHFEIKKRRARDHSSALGGRTANFWGGLGALMCRNVCQFLRVFALSNDYEARRLGHVGGTSTGDRVRFRSSEGLN